MPLGTTTGSRRPRCPQFISRFLSELEFGWQSFQAKRRRSRKVPFQKDLLGAQAFRIRPLPYRQLSTRERQWLAYTVGSALRVLANADNYKEDKLGGVLIGWVSKSVTKPNLNNFSLPNQPKPANLQPQKPKVITQNNIVDILEWIIRFNVEADPIKPNDERRKMLVSFLKANCRTRNAFNRALRTAQGQWRLYQQPQQR